MVIAGRLDDHMAIGRKTECGRMETRIPGGDLSLTRLKVRAVRFGDMKHLHLSFLLLAGMTTFGPIVSAAPAEPAFTFTPEMESMLRLQVFLDRAGFGPGKID